MKIGINSHKDINSNIGCVVPLRKELKLGYIQTTQMSSQQVVNSLGHTRPMGEITT